jgi:hypothetical protein
MTDEQLNRLSMLTGLFEKCAKMGGTKGFEKIQPLVQEDLKKLLDEISPKESPLSEKRVAPTFPARAFTPEHKTDVDRRV